MSAKTLQEAFLGNGHHVPTPQDEERQDGVTRPDISNGEEPDSLEATATTFERGKFAFVYGI